MMLISHYSFQYENMISEDSQMVARANPAALQNLIVLIDNKIMCSINSSFGINDALIYIDYTQQPVIR